MALADAGQIRKGEKSQIDFRPIPIKLCRHPYGLPGALIANFIETS
jgi:hypothetical protein